MAFHFFNEEATRFDIYEQVRAVYDGPRWLGWTKPPIPMVHAVEYYYELIKSGRIKKAPVVKAEPEVTAPATAEGVAAE